MNKEELIKKQKRINIFFNIIYIFLLICVGFYILDYLFIGCIEDFILALLYLILCCIFCIFEFLVDMEFKNKIKEVEKGV